MRQQEEMNPTSATTTLGSNGLLGMNLQSPWNSAGTKHCPTTQSVRCASTGCECKAFQPRVNAIRQCSGCSHSWVFHACSKFQNLPPFFGNSLKSDPGLIIVLFETMSMALLGCHAIPTRIKILLDRIWSSSRLQVDLTQFLLSFGWTLQDYTRGYMLTDHKGQLRDRWVSCRVEEEALIIQQFLRFLETRHLAHDMLVSLEAEKSAFPIELNLPPTADHLFGPLLQCVAKPQETTKKEEAEVTTTVPSFSTPNLASELSTRFVAAMAAAALTSKVSFPKLPVMPPPLPPLPSTGWCGKSEGGAQISGDIGAIPELTFPPPAPPPPPPPLSAFAATVMDAADITGGAFKVNERKKSLTGLFDIWNAPFDSLSDIKTTHTDCKAEAISGLDYVADFSITSTTAAAATSIGGKQQRSTRATSNRKTPASENKRQQHNNGSHFVFSECKQDTKQALNAVSPMSAPAAALILTGRNKKRVLCTTCKKSFCDKGALKIHYSAVHLREMHKCTIKGCNMWFSSRRSRNRHSANPNPRLHMTHSGKKLPDNATIVDDGSGQGVLQRSQMPSAVLNPPILSPFTKNTTPSATIMTSTTTPTAPTSPSSIPLNLSDPSLHLPPGVCQVAEVSRRQTSASSDEGGDEGIYISERGQMEDEEEEGGDTEEGESMVVGHSNHRSPATEFSASNLAQSSPSPPSSLHFGGSPPRSEEGKATGGVLMA
ncbi:Zinc finger protein basonuclin-2 [Echinococcus granulosus]|uniref:Zinc finger protein basonuclin 1 n=1 Tax=Echinococcus granulosus TaxID=6210 RepID=A0A068WAW0_ECHGR|nr:Zinc finger protein basonuclin-2 [Echinococcus granulosus]CDS17213.1 zinc finger protein basonuclin 1 [Echinococcus granulosus]